MHVFRRIELIHPPGVGFDGESYPGWKQGLTPISWPEVADAWVDDLLGPSRSTLPPNCRFYFTEKGWREVGRNVVAAARRTSQEYRVIAIKETDAQVVWRDKVRGYEVAVQPPSKRRAARSSAAVVE
jgi:hypothetical protein